ncbi:MAG TPA: SDR family NAD(P)-dependent oxidoreductase [Acidimicrobiales bacterium]
MELSGKVAVVTGGASGIGRALATRFVAERAKAVVVADRDAEGAAAVARQIGDGAHAFTCDVSKEDDVVALIDATESAHGDIDLFCSNAGIGTGGGPEAPNEEWQRIWEINLMAHVYAARALVPKMLERGDGYLLNTASAAGLLSQIGSAPYAVTKHAAVAFAEWLSMTYGDRGIKVSVLCPQGVRTPMLGEAPGALLGPTAIEPEDVADTVVAGLAAEEFLILPHPEVREFFRRKGDDYERWLRGMRRLQARVMGFPEP